MPRIYKVTFENVSVSAAQDLIQIKGASNKILRILRRWVECVDQTAPTGQMLRLRERILPATVTDGSGGSTPTPAKTDQGDAGASFTALANNTTQATTNGTAVAVGTTGCHIFNGYDDIHDEPPTVIPTSSYVLELLGAPLAAVHLSGGVEVEEIG
ncbi:hypothetical protein H8A97_13060 [Bradyrhizobium sp. Arg62]|uniref:hypothetical protein n=1 Tax=Bradyrhizobium brasilense TaxID=1419277 RepID=UPI001E425FD7|nr:hypothetical protein [Bradyrhizobium brasilense]MCC8946003.1 hypothetical protein [Bradyrhizobium brasilense]